MMIRSPNRAVLFLAGAAGVGLAVTLGLGLSTESAVRDNQEQRPGRQPPVPAHEAVMAGSALERRQPGDKHDGDQQ